MISTGGVASFLLANQQHGQTEAEMQDPWLRLPEFYNHMVFPGGQAFCLSMISSINVVSATASLGSTIGRLRMG